MSPSHYYYKLFFWYGKIAFCVLVGGHCCCCCLCASIHSPANSRYGLHSFIYLFSSLSFVFYTLFWLVDLSEWNFNFLYFGVSCNSTLVKKCHAFNYNQIQSHRRSIQITYTFHVLRLMCVIRSFRLCIVGTWQLCTLIFSIGSIKSFYFFFATNNLLTPNDKWSSTKLIIATRKNGDNQ